MFVPALTVSNKDNFTAGPREISMGLGLNFVQKSSVNQSDQATTQVAKYFAEVFD